MACCAEPMGLRVVGDDLSEFNRKYRWLFNVRGLGDGTGVSGMPHRRGARPIIGWKEYDLQHLNETIHYPFKPAWEPIEVVLYDARKCGAGRTVLNPVFSWIQSSSSGLYDPRAGTWRPVVTSQFKRTADLFILGGNGHTNEHWVLENCYPQHVRWGDLDMDSSDPLTVDVTLRYDRAYCLT